MAGHVWLAICDRVEMIEYSWSIIHHCFFIVAHVMEYPCLVTNGLPFTVHRFWLSTAAYPWQIGYFEMGVYVWQRILWLRGLGHPRLTKNGCPFVVGHFCCEIRAAL